MQMKCFNIKAYEGEFQLLTRIINYILHNLARLSYIFFTRLRNAMPPRLALTSWQVHHIRTNSNSDIRDDYDMRVATFETPSRVLRSGKSCWSNSSLPGLVLTSIRFHI